MEKMEEVKIEVEMRGTFNLGNDKDVCLGLEIEVPGNAEFRNSIKYGPILSPHIATYWAQVVVKGEV